MNQLHVGIDLSGFISKEIKTNHRTGTVLGTIVDFNDTPDPTKITFILQASKKGEVGHDILFETIEWKEFEKGAVSIV
jgi:hypothetical protein